MVDIDDTRVRGIAMGGIVAALKPAYAAKPELVPAELRQYLEIETDAERFYPLSAYVALAKILASTMDPAKAKGDVYRAFGVIAAQRDVFGVAPNVPENQRPKHSAIFDGALRGVTGLGSLVRRALALRERYYSRGYYTIKRAGDRKVEVTLQDFPACKEMCAISTGYLTHVMRTAKPGTWVERLSCRGNGDSDCRWELRFPDDTDPKEVSVFD